MRWLLDCAFGAVAQCLVGVVCFGGGVIFWAVAPRTVDMVFHISMFFGLVACYGIIATGLSVLWLDKKTPDA